MIVLATAAVIVPLAIEKAGQKAEARGLSLELVVADALALGALGRSFATVIDSAVFHVFGDDERPRYVESLARVLEPGGRTHARAAILSQAAGGAAAD
jgi:ubiquinone/menaquinone biosynthesis C-methylase UbiE